MKKNRLVAEGGRLAATRIPKVLQQERLVQRRQVEAATRLLDRPRIALRLFEQPGDGAAQVLVSGRHRVGVLQGSMDRPYAPRSDSVTPPPAAPAGSLISPRGFVPPSGENLSSLLERMHLPEADKNAFEVFCLFGLTLRLRILDIFMDQALNLA